MASSICLARCPLHAFSSVDSSHKKGIGPSWASPIRNARNTNLSIDQLQHRCPDYSSRLDCTAFTSSFSFVASALFSPSSCITLNLCATVATRWAGKALRMPLRVRRTKSATKSPSLPLPFQRRILRIYISSKTINPHKKLQKLQIIIECRIMVC